MASRDPQRFAEGFTSDGCTFLNKVWPSLAADIHEECVWHDYEYWLGGTEARRKQVDKEFRRRVARKKGWLVANIIYRFVRGFGYNAWPGPPRWNGKLRQQNREIKHD